jgi:hypothetical protein
MRGMIFIIESVIAGIILIAFLSLIPVLRANLPITENPGWEILEQIDSQGRLRNWTISQDVAGLNSQIEIQYWNHSIQICNITTCVGDVPNVSQLLISTRFIAGEENYSPHIVRLILWK